MISCIRRHSMLVIMITLACMVIFPYVYITEIRDPSYIGQKILQQFENPDDWVENTPGSLWIRNKNTGLCIWTSEDIFFMDIANSNLDSINRNWLTWTDLIRIRRKAVLIYEGLKNRYKNDSKRKVIDESFIRILDLEK